MELRRLFCTVVAVIYMLVIKQQLDSKPLLLETLIGRRQSREGRSCLTATLLCVVYQDQRALESREWCFSNIRTQTGSRTFEWRTNVWRSCACRWRALWLQMKLLVSALCTPQLFCTDSVAVLNTSCLQSISCSVYTVQFSFQSILKRFKRHLCNGLKFHSFSWPGIFCISCL